MTLTITTFTLDDKTYTLKEDLVFDVPFNDGFYELIDKELSFYIIEYSLEQVEYEYKKTFVRAYETYKNINDDDLTSNSLEFKKKLMDMIISVE